MIVFLTHSRKRLERPGRQKTSEDISGHLVTSGLSRIYKIEKWNFRFQPLGGARNLFFRLRHRDQKVKNSNPSDFHKKIYTGSEINDNFETRLRRVKTLPLSVQRSADS